MPFVSHEYLQSISSEKHDELYRTSVPLGYQPETGDELLMRSSDRYAGTYVLGVQGGGKSGLLENMIATDMAAGNAVIVIDPHGDLMTHCLAILPPHRLKQAYILDMEDETCPFGVNLFSVGKLSTSVAQAQAVDRIMGVFDRLWPDVLAQQHLPRYLRAATITFLSNPGATLVDMHAFLLDEQLRARMLKNVTDPTVRQFWQSQYDDLSAAERMRRVQPLIGRLEALFMGRSLVRNLVGQRQRRQTINFRKAIENKELIFVRLPVKTLKQDAEMIGTMIVSQIHAAVFSFADVPEQMRPGVSLYVDEFQHFATPDFSELFTEGRKFGVRVTVAHQFRGQLPNYLRDSTMTARNKICFKTTPEDGREMAYVFPSTETIVRAEDISAHPVEHLLTYGSNNPFAQQLIETYLRPLLSQKRGGKVDIEGRQLTFDLWHGTKMRNVYVSDPTPYLDNLLYQVMKTGDANLPIPPEAVVGFANCGRSFFSQVRGISSRDVALSPQVRFPRALVVPAADGDLRWTRRPEGSMEQFYHLLFHLRMTMFYLAEEPIGKKSPTSTTAVGQMLTDLPPRAAFVHTAETVGVIYTHNTPRRVTGNELVARAKAILTQTRQKYCHPRTEVEKALMHANAPSTPTLAHSDVPTNAIAAPQLSRWEEI